MSSDLEWLLLRGNNSFIVKRLSGGPILSKERGNLVNIHSQKFSGLANTKTIDVSPSANGIAVIHRKKSSSPHAVRSAYASTVIGTRTGPRRALGIAAQLSKRGYRPDLRRNPLETLLDVMKDGRGHVCKINPYPDGADQTPLELSSYAIGARSMIGASCRRIGDDIATLARVSALVATQREPKTAPPKKVRGKKAKV